MRRTLFVLVALCAAVGVTLVTTSYLLEKIDVKQPPQIIVESAAEPVRVVVLQRPVTAGSRIDARRDLAIAPWPTDVSASLLVIPEGASDDGFVSQYDGMYVRSNLLPGQPLATGLIDLTAPQPPAPPAEPISIVTEQPAWEPLPGGPTTDASYEHPSIRPDVAMISVEEAGELYLGGVRQVDLYRLQATPHGRFHRLVPVVLNKALERVEGPAVPRGLSFYIQQLTPEQQAALALTRADGCLHVAPSGAALQALPDSSITTASGRFIDRACQPLSSNGNDLLRLEDYDTQRDTSLREG